MTRFPRYIAKLETGVLVDYRQVGLDPLPNKQRGTIPISRPVGSARGIPPAAQYCTFVPSESPLVLEQVTLEQIGMAAQYARKRGDSLLD